MKRWLALLALLPLAGCARKALEGSTARGLEAGLALREFPRWGGARTLTDANGSVERVTRSADGRVVDIDSELELIPLADAIRTAARGRAAALEIERLEAQTAALADVLELLVAYVGARDEAFEAYRLARESEGDAASFTAFSDKRSAAAVLERRVIGELTALDARLAARTELNARAADFAQIADFLNVKFLELDARLAELLEAVTYEVRLEAFLRSPGKEPTPVHLPGYDRLDEGELVRRDRRGLMLEGVELERFEELREESERLAELGNRYLEGQAELAEVFEALADTILADLGAFAQELDGLRVDVESDEFAQHLGGLRASFEALRRTLESASGELAPELEQELAGRVSASLEHLESGSRASFRSLANHVQTLRDVLHDPQPESIQRAVRLIHRLVTEAGTWGAAADALTTELESLLASLGDEAGALPETLRAFVQSSALLESTGLEAEIDYFGELAERTGGLLTAAEELLRLDGNLRPLSADLRVPGAIDVDLDAARPSALRLRRTQRLDGDTLSLRMTVLEPSAGSGERTVGEPVLVDLEIGTIGWHARLDPGVVLARPDGGVQTGSAEFRFAPIVSWLWNYRPPDDATGFWNSAARGTGFGVGPHATFLSFDPDSEVEIGLGVTLSLWNGVLLLGGGVDLMASDDDTYAFVGSSLIGLLQQLGDS